MPRIVTIDETGSTNADLLTLVPEGVEEGLWLRAERQTSGRGRRGRSWASAPGNLYTSTVVRLRPNDPLAATLALVAAVALADTIGALGCAVTLKWPNDVLLHGAKVSGILLERIGDAVVIGFGVNLRSAPQLPDRKTTALAELIPPIGAGPFLDQLADVFAAALSEWRERGIGAIVHRWTALAHPIGTPLLVTLPDGETVHGSYDGLAPDGALNLRLAGGGVRAIHAGDVFLL